MDVIHMNIVCGNSPKFLKVSLSETRKWLFLWRWYYSLSKQFNLFSKSLSVNVKTDIVFEGHCHFSVLSWQEECSWVEQGQEFAQRLLPRKLQPSAPNNCISLSHQQWQALIQWLTPGCSNNLFDNEF